MFYVFGYARSRVAVKGEDSSGIEHPFPIPKPSRSMGVIPAIVSMATSSQ